MLNSHSASIFLILGRKQDKDGWRWTRLSSEASVWSEPEETSHVPVREKIITFGQVRPMALLAKMQLKNEIEIKNTGDARCALAKHRSIAPLSSTSINAGKFSTLVNQVHREIQSAMDSIQICPSFHDLPFSMPRSSTQLPCPALGIQAPQELQLHGKQCKIVKKGWLSCHSWDSSDKLPLKQQTLQSYNPYTNGTTHNSVSFVLNRYDVPSPSSWPCHGVAMVSHLHLLDAIFRQHGSSTTNAAKVEPPILLARISHLEHQGLVLKADANELTYCLGKNKVSRMIHIDLVRWPENCSGY